MATTTKRNAFAIWVSVAVVAVLVGLAALVVWMNNAATSPGTTPDAANIDASTGAISIGDGPDELATYIDFMCPVCGTFEQAYGPTIESLVDDGSLTLQLHPISILDRASQGTEFSTRAANAMYCVAEAEPAASLPFLQAMFANQPAEGSAGLTDEQMVEIADAAGAGSAGDCITSGTYAQFVGAMTEKTPIAPGAQRIGTPTIAVNGEVISNAELPADPADLPTLFG